jgi:hypothetical protein
MVTGSFKLIVVQAVFGTLLAAAFLGCRKQSISTPGSQVLEAWDEANSPVLMGVKSKTFGVIAREGALPNGRYPWTDDYWATYRGGIALRWQKGTNSIQNSKEFVYPLLDLKRLKTMSQAELDRLSPAEKYDLAYGRYDFPLVKQQWEEARDLQREMGEIPRWYGICHGWASASLAEPEPGERASIVNPDGVRVNFFASDIKALLSKVYADGHQAETLVGKRCGTLSHEISTDLSGRVVLPECRDLNPAALHLILAQNLGEKNPSLRRGFVIDIAGDVEVWNHPVVGFKVLSSHRRIFDRKSDPKRQYRAKNTAFIVELETSIFYVSEGKPSKSPLREANRHFQKSLRLKYSLELDSKDQIIGGEWTSEDHPDFLWHSNKRPEAVYSPVDPKNVYDLAVVSRNRE